LNQTQPEPLPFASIAKREETEIDMDKVTLGLAAVVATASAGLAQAAPTVPQQASSFHELLAPIPNASEKLAQSDALLEQRQASEAKLIKADFHHHHHHHHHFWRRHHHHHHHHFWRRHRD
jgi:hypothetical protein